MSATHANVIVEIESNAWSTPESAGTPHSEPTSSPLPPATNAPAMSTSTTQIAATDADVSVLSASSDRICNRGGSALRESHGAQTATKHTPNKSRMNRPASG